VRVYREYSVVFRAAVLTPWLRGTLRLSRSEVTGEIPRSFMGFPRGQTPVNAQFGDLAEDLTVGRTRTTPVERLLNLEEIGVVLLALVFAPALALCVIIWANLGPVAGWTSLVLLATVLAVTIALHGWTLSGLTPRPISVSWLDRRQVQQFAHEVNAARQRSQRPESGPW
jgi:energy-converting hydrogenase Eha subunit E